MKSIIKLRFVALVLTVGAIAIAGCGSKADVVANNLSTQADNFNVPRTITFYNGITGKAPLIIKGLCSLGDGANQDAPNNGGVLTVTCKVRPNQYIKDFLGLSNNITYFVNQQVGVAVSDTHYQFIWRPGTLIPGISVQ